MKKLLVILTALLWLGLTPGLASQTSDSPAGNHLPEAVAAARCQYIPADPACAGASEPGPAQHSDTVAQASFPRRMPGPAPYPRRPPMAYGSRGYPGMGGPTVSGRHMLIGALVGFGLGAAAGAKANTDTHPGVETKAVVLVGSLGGVLGALIGAAVPAFPTRSRHWRHSWPDDEEVQATVRGQGGSGTRGQRSEVRGQ